MSLAPHKKDKFLMQQESGSKPYRQISAGGYSLWMIMMSIDVGSKIGEADGSIQAPGAAGSIGILDYRLR